MQPGRSATGPKPKKTNTKNNNPNSVTWSVVTRISPFDSALRQTTLGHSIAKRSVEHDK